MSDSSDDMEFSPTNIEQAAACEKLRDTVTGISALHLSIQGMDGRSPSPRNSFKDLYLSTQAMIRRKEEMDSTKFSKKRKQKGKDSTEEFIFPKKTARPISPTLTQDPIETNNSFSDLEQDVEHPPPTVTVTTEVVTPKITPPHPIMLKIKDNFREQIKCISENFPNLQGLGIRDDPVLHERDQAIEIFKETVEFEKGRYIVQLPFRKSYNELSDNYPLAKQRFQNLWRRFGHDSELYQQYREIIRDYTEQGIIEEVKTEITDNKLKDLLNAIAFCSDIKQAFLQICLADEHKDAVRFLWSDDEPCVHKRPKLQVYRFNRVNFGVSSSPFLLAATIRHHIEKYKHEFPDTVELLDRNFYVDDLISGGNEFEEALQTSRRAKNIMEAAGMDLRKWITNDANLMEQWKKENFNVHPVHETVSLGANGTKVLGLSWNTNEDYLTTDTKSLLEFVSLDKNTKRFILQAVGKIFDPLGIISPFTVRMKCLLQNLWKEETQWDDPLPTHNEKEWKKWCEELPHLRNLKIPRLVLDSTLLEDDVELHSFCDASKKAYGAAIYLRTKSRNGISVKLVTSKNRVAPLNCVTLPRLELLGALVAARVASKVKKIVNLKRSCLQYHWTDSKIVLFWIKGNKARWKQFVANRVSEITSLTDPHSWYHCAGKENPADFLSRGLSADCLVSNSRWWTACIQDSHVGPQGLLNAVRQKFWPLSGRSIARKTVHQCVICFKSRPILSSQIMGNLPSERVNISSPFTISGLDLCGPFLVKYKNQRKGTLNKVYIFYEGYPSRVIIGSTFRCFDSNA
ncbi:integrase catalytic domain-containing protein [Trichonephila clavipes]|nr:integrase catalytic domain-containing protein [Trichonephila clavipes]